MTKKGRKKLHYPVVLLKFDLKKKRQEARIRVHLIQNMNRKVLLKAVWGLVEIIIVIVKLN